MKVVNFILTSASLGGAELFTLDLARACGIEARVTIVGAAESALCARAELAGLGTRHLDLGQKLGRRTAIRNLASFRFARSRLSREIAANASRGEWSVLQFKWEELLWAGDPAPDRVCLLEHGPIPPQLRRVQWARRRLVRAFREAAVVYAVSRPAQDSIRALAGREPTSLRGGVDTTYVSDALRSAPDVASRYKPEGALLVAFAGRLTRTKGAQSVVELALAYRDISAIVVGDGPQRVRLEQRAAADPSVQFAGFVPDALPYLAAADVTLLLSTQHGEGRPLTALESVAVGTPVVGLSSSPALRAFAEEFGSDWVELVETADPRSVREAIERLIPRHRTAPRIPTWADTARTFLRGLERVS